MSSEDEDTLSDTDTIDENEDIENVAIWIENYIDNDDYYYYRFVPETGLDENDIDLISDNLSKILIGSTIVIEEDALKISYNNYTFDLSFNNGSRQYVWRVADIARY